jgi:hypothetical protein
VRIEIYDSVMRSHVIGSKNARLIGDWFAEHAALLMSADSRELTQIRIWPEDDEEIRIVGGHARNLRFTQDDLLYLAEQILNASKALGG